ncbi:protein FLX-like 4 [Cornus florida]|uniref:protein FLX-like 4 n=1 Tax=Cornus florida TaxID=4283 RepID=UPI0028A0C6E0|nr:protein FLX-like 4 [Cornus florida]XP_059637573.1 protein FLX-like 4 [Cornus florida]XP_059637574.1 protein FLX-like 4 [Cornus florida]XP_059637575.1 protein FLX-like 4 [Cornus florida]
MGSRGQIPLSYEGRSVQAPGMMRHGPFPTGHRPMEPLPPPELLENKMAVQLEEIERLVEDNRRLAATHVALRQDLVAAQQEIQRLRAHIRSIQTESDIQIRMLLDKIAKMEVDIRAGESVKKDLQQAHMEAQSLVTARQELTAKIQRATEELDKAHADIKKLPEMHAELDSLRQEHQRLRNTFEYEKGLNMEKVEQMQAMDKNLFGMAKEVEKLRAEVLNAEKRAHAPNPYGSSYMMSSDPLYPPPVHGGGAYVDPYGRPHVQMGVGAGGEGIVPYGSGNVAAAPSGIGNATGPGPSAGGTSVWGGAYDAMIARK